MFVYVLKWNWDNYHFRGKSLEKFTDETPVFCVRQHSIQKLPENFLKAWDGLYKQNKAELIQLCPNPSKTLLNRSKSSLVTDTTWPSRSVTSDLLFCGPSRGFLCVVIVIIFIIVSSLHKLVFGANVQIPQFTSRSVLRSFWLHRKRGFSVYWFVFIYFLAFVNFLFKWFGRSKAIIIISISHSQTYSWHNN